MKIKDFLQTESLINLAELARKIYPNKSAVSKLSNKVFERKAGNSVQRITDDDEQMIKVELNKLADKIKSLD